MFDLNRKLCKGFRQDAERIDSYDINNIPPKTQIPAKALILSCNGKDMKVYTFSWNVPVLVTRNKAIIFRGTKNENIMTKMWL